MEGTQHLFFTAAAKSVNKTQLECQQPQHPLQHHQLGNVWLVSPARTDGLVASTWNKKELENLYWIHNLDLSGYWKLSRFHWMHVWTSDSTENQCSNHFQLHPKNIYIYILYIYVYHWRNFTFPSFWGITRSICKPLLRWGAFALAVGCNWANRGVRKWATPILHHFTMASSRFISRCFP